MHFVITLVKHATILQTSGVLEHVHTLSNYVTFPFLLSTPTLQVEKCSQINLFFLAQSGKKL